MPSQELLGRQREIRHREEGGGWSGSDVATSQGSPRTVGTPGSQQGKGRILPRLWVGDQGQLPLALWTSTNGGELRAHLTQTQTPRLGPQCDDSGA